MGPRCRLPCGMARIFCSSSSITLPLTNKKSPAVTSAPVPTHHQRGEACGYCTPSTADQRDAQTGAVTSPTADALGYVYPVRALALLTSNAVALRDGLAKES